MNFEAFIRGGGSVCPFAARSQRLYATIGDRPPREARPLLLGAAYGFPRTMGKLPPGALIVVGAVEGFEPTKTWAREVFLELMICLVIVGGSNPEFEAKLVDHVDREVRPVLFDDADPKRPVLACNGLPLFAVCMAPVYPKNHPRYAPQPAVVVTWKADVQLASTDPALSRIRAAMKREHGSVYDADELMLPLPGTEPATSRAR